MPIGRTRDILRGLRARSGHPADVTMPLRIGAATLDAAIVRPLSERLAADGLGVVTGHAVRPGRDGDPRAATLRLLLADPRRRTLETVGGMLSDLGAPLGSVLCFTETGVRHVFGRTEGLGLALPVARLTDDAIAACSGALGSTGTFRAGPADGTGPLLCFYGETYLAMERRLMRLAGRDPRFRPATFARLT